MRIDFSERIGRLPPYLFAELERIIAEKKRQGKDIISLSIGDPDLPPPPSVLESFRKEAANPANHKYSFSQGEPDFREAVANWYEKRFKVKIDPKSEVIALLGSKEGIANVARAFVNAGDRVLVPDPSYPVYSNGGALLNDGVPLVMPLLEENGYRPDLESLNDAKMMFLNYPNNPTGAVVNESFLKKVIDIAREKNIIVCYDNAYSEIVFDDYRAPSILEIDGAMDVAVEFHSCSKTFNMTGDRIGFAVGNRKLIEGLVKVKSQIDSGPPVYIQKVAKQALEGYVNGDPPEHLKTANRTYRQRRDTLVEGLKSIGLECEKPKGTFYVWPRCEEKSMDLTMKLLDVGVVVTPGIGFGKFGEHHIRFALTRPKEEIEEACKRISKALRR